jgi:transcriptional regulator with XRE-family HTH domain
LQGDRLREARNRKNISQDKLAERIGASPAQVRRYESGQADPSLGVLKRIMDELDVSADWLLGIDPIAVDNLSAAEGRLIQALRESNAGAIFQLVAAELGRGER